MKYKVTATNDKITRTEIIDTDSNELFANAQNISDIKNIYEAFWHNENIKVIDVKAVQ